MPIYHKTPPPSTVGNHNTAEIDYHNSEAAKVKRTREQAYFNSYDFDAIEVLPYDDEEDEDGEGKDKDVQRKREQRQLKSIQARQQQNKLPQQSAKHHYHQHTQHPQQHYQQQTPNHTLKAASSSCNSFIVDNCQQHSHHPLHHVNSKFNPSICFQRISSIFTSKTNNKPQLKHDKQQQQLQHNQCTNVSGVGNNNIAVALSAPSHDNKHLKMSSSKISSTTLCPSSSSSSSTIIKEIFMADDNDSDVIATSSGLLPIECARDITGIGTHSRDTGMITCTSATTTATTTTTDGIATSTNAAGSSGNFLLPRAMLKYQSSTLNTQQGATGTPTVITNSMPLASLSAAINSRSSSTSPTKKILKTAKNVRKLDGLNAMIPSTSSNVGLRLKKTSSSSSIITSITSEDIEEEEEEERDLEENEDNDELESKLKAVEKVIPKALNTKITARASSHQSHYSTDKSASSGYYSSNVCSTYSLEEHIYSEPTLDLDKLKNNGKESKLPSATSLRSFSAEVAATPTAVSTAAAAVATTPSTINKLPQHQQQSNNLLTTTNETNSVMRSLDVKRHCYRFAENGLQTLPPNRNSQEFSENLKILESSIENLDRHLKSFPSVTNQEALVNYAQIPYNPYASINHNDKLRASSSYHQLPTIQESLDAVKNHGQSWPEDNSDDSLRDIDLDSFLLDKDKKQASGKTKKALNSNSKGGVDNPTFLTDEQEENHYKCAKYINSCPEDAYRVESDIIAPARSSISGQSLAVSVDLYPKRYEDQLHFQNTRELLEDVRDKIRLLTQTQKTENLHCQPILHAEEDKEEECIPKELHNMINTLKHELELYLDRMNQHSELEIRQLCTGLVKNQHIVKMKNAFERRRSLTETTDIYSTYEAVQDGIVMNAQGVPINIRKHITSIRCSSDPNFKMKRKAITEVFPMAECYVESLEALHNSNSTSKPLNKSSQLQRNLSYHKPVLEQLHPANTNTKLKGNSGNNGNNNNNKGSSSGNGSSGDTSEPTDKESILDWHRKKPSIWEMYYGTNRIQQSLLGGKRNGMMVTTASTGSPSTMCYPSSRPESDFTLDLPRAEQLRIKMEKEKKFRQRCRVITTFLSLVFFLLTVMVVSLVLTRGKRMFGSMI